MIFSNQSVHKFQNSFKKVQLLVFLLMTVWMSAQENFSIVSSSTSTTIVIDKKEPKVVQIAAELLQKDILSITDQKINIQNTVSNQCILAGTIGKSKLINELIQQQKIQVQDVQNKWETYKILMVHQPFKNVEKALVIVGSDRRGTAYGILEISRMLGVSPWEWWADVQPEKNEEISISITPKTYGEPSVKYRGVFLNDEDWGLQRWAALNFEQELGDIGPKTYAKAFELLLRLRANTIWPAMHSCTGAFYSYPENKKVADDYAIVIGTSHAEPMLSNINKEWNHKTMGAYRYDTNAETIKNFFDKRAKETKNYEGMYTLAMRGEHDSPMIVETDDTKAQVTLLEKVIEDQRAILDKYHNAKVPKPQIFVPYKEVLHYYQNGLKVPEDVTLVWTDDNYGYIRQLSNPEEQQRSGGAGVYYHTSYWGRPHDYLWLNSTNPVLLWEEMSKAYEFNARNLWILNVGDIKPHEYNMDLFLDMAWNMDSFQKSNAVQSHRIAWLTQKFGKENSQQLNALFRKNDSLSFTRRPEFMAWSSVEPVTKANETALTQIHYGDEVGQRVSAYKEISENIEQLSQQIPDAQKAAFFQLVYYPLMSTANMNFKWLYAYKNQFVAKQNRTSARYFAEQSALAYEAIQNDTKFFNDSISNGKWKYIMNDAPRNLPVFQKPVTASVDEVEETSFGLALEGHEMEWNTAIINSFAQTLPVFNAYTKSTYYIDVFLKGSNRLEWKSSVKNDWIQLSKSDGFLDKNHPEERIWVTIDWSKVPKAKPLKEAPLGHDYQLIPPSYKINSAIEISSNHQTKTVGVSVYNPQFSELDDFHGFVEDKGFVVINAAHFSDLTKGKAANFEVLDGIGYAGKTIVALPRTAASITKISKMKDESAALHYDFYTFNKGEASIYLRTLPTHAFFEGSGVRFAVAVDDASPVIVDFKTEGRSETWKANVLKNSAIQSFKTTIEKPGKHRLTIYMVDPGVMLDQILIDLGGKKSSYNFPKETRK
ncbi:Glycosyl hydrolase family 115 [Pustulibacterium marinum]|uniref:Glycosyl hydrolase family 115 n=1 Tax=Pustulibacterium marinum TaxID=1224947 RepID=A0A1I7IAC5_9FLAO|nr:glycosyl hydrolase 115 family protein [Pustulibacterium marinum]SFU69889.1 Glycosyl hydrolase family 115 [Pustulibacterium marinum]